MPKKETTTKKTKKLNETDRKNIAKRGKEFTDWMMKNVNQKWFFSLEEREQKLLEMSYVVVLQICPELTWENFIERLRMVDRVKVWWKAIAKKVIWKL